MYLSIQTSHDKKLMWFNFFNCTGLFKDIRQLLLFLVFQGCMSFARHMVKDITKKCYYTARAVALLARVANQ